MPIIATPTAIPDVLIIEPKFFGDDRGFFYESFNQNEFNQAVGFKVNFVQDNHSKSKRGVLRGLHYQTTNVQSKLVRVVSGSVFDVAVDLRIHSATYGKWVGVELSSDNKRQLWVPEGFAHGFLVLSEDAEFLYKTSDYWNANSENSIAWNDPSLKIDWPLAPGQIPNLSLKDAQGMPFDVAPKFSEI
jgi:dTDP-4-dehydrorhamnose 3,5-epimerase